MTRTGATRIEWTLGLLLVSQVSCAVTPPASPPPSGTEPPPVVQSRPPHDRSRHVLELKRRVEAAELKLAQAQIEVEHGDLRHRQTIGRLEKEFELARRRLEIFTKMTIPARIARAELQLRKAEEECRVAEEDLAILEAAPPGETAGNVPTEVAVARARRRLERAETAQRLQRQELRILQDILLPLERMEHELEGERRRHAILETHWDNERALLDRRLAVLYADIELTRLEHELAEAQANLPPPGARSGHSPPGPSTP